MVTVSLALLHGARRVMNFCTAAEDGCGSLRTEQCHVVYTGGNTNSVLTWKMAICFHLGLVKTSLASPAGAELPKCHLV